MRVTPAEHVSFAPDHTQPGLYRNQHPRDVARALDELAQRVQDLAGGAESFTTLVAAIVRGLDGAAPGSITFRGGDGTTGTATGGSVEMRGGAGFGNGSGGDVNVAPGIKAGIGTNGKLQLKDAGGAVKMLISATGAISFGGDVSFSGHRLTNAGGRREALHFGWNTTNNAANRHLYSAGLAISGSTTSRGYTALRDGSIVGIAFLCDINAYTSGDVKAEALVDGVATGAEAIIGSPAVADGLAAYATFAVGTYTFSAGDKLLAARRLTGTATTDDLSVIVEVEFDG